MNSSRRTFLAAGATGGLALTAGCLDFVLGRGPLEFQAARVAPTDGALDETGYEEESVDEETIEERVEASGVEREVRASYWVSTYTNAVEYEGEEREAALFGSVAVPAMEIAGRSFNPLDDLSNRELLEEFLGEVDDGDQIENLDHGESFSLSVLDAVRDIDVFVGETELDGDRIDVDVVVTSFTHEDDMIILLGSYPSALADEGPAIEALIESVEHPL